MLGTASAAPVVSVEEPRQLEMLWAESSSPAVARPIAVAVGKVLRLREQRC